LGLAALYGHTEDARARLPEASQWLPIPGQRNAIGAWLVLETMIPALMLIGERDRCAQLHASANQLVPTGLVCEFLSIGPTNPRLAAGISAWGAGRIDDAHGHFAAAARQARTVPFRILQPAADYWYGRMLREVGDASAQARGRAMLEAAAADF